MSLIGMGRQNLRLATAGFAKNAEIEAKENSLRDQIEAAKKGQAMQTYGAGATIGGMYGMKALDSAASPVIGQLAPIGQTLGGGSISAPVSNTLVAPAEALGSVGLSGSAPGGVSVSQGMLNAGLSFAAPGGVSVSQGVLNAGLPSASGGVTGGATGTAVTGSSSIMSSLATVAAPVAIGLGVAYLINKLFD